MTAYIIADSLVTDAAKYEGYKQIVPSTLARFGGRFVVRGGVAVRLEGEWSPNRIVIIEFPSLDQAKAWYQSVEYTAARRVRAGAAKINIIAVSGI